MKKNEREKRREIVAERWQTRTEMPSSGFQALPTHAGDIDRRSGVATLDANHDQSRKLCVRVLGGG